MPSSVAERRDARARAPVVTGIGVATGFGFGKPSLIDGLFGERMVFAPLARPGRQPPWGGAPFVGVELLDPPEVLSRRVARTTGVSGRATAAVVQEAWTEAGLERVDPTRIGLVIGGSNLQNRELFNAARDATLREGLVSPHLGYSFFDTDLAGLCAEMLGIRGRTWSVGGGAAAGAVAVIQAAEAVANGRLDACIAVGALQDLSFLELQALSVMGALAPRDAAAGGCRPFDRRRDGTVFGESAAALVIERGDVIVTGGGYGRITGTAHIADGHRGPDPSLEGELRAIAGALGAAGVSAAEIAYVNAHGTGTPLGDDTEVAAYRAAGLEGAYINATKSILGHGIASAGAVEVAVTLLQMRASRLHPTRNLADPIDPDLRWVRGAPVTCEVPLALSLSFGFGGINTAIVLSTPEDKE
jgi:malonyl-[acp] decarboxylase